MPYILFATDDFDSLDRSIQRRVDEKLRELEVNPRPAKSKWLRRTKQKGEAAIEVRRFKPIKGLVVVYEIRGQGNKVVVTRIFWRGQGY